MLFAWAGTFIVSCSQTLLLLGLRPSYLDQDLKRQSPNSQAFGLSLNYLASFPGFVDDRPWDFLASIIAWSYSCNKRPLRAALPSVSVSEPTSILLVPFLWRTLTDTGGKFPPSHTAPRSPQNPGVHLNPQLWMQPKEVFLTLLRYD